LCSLHRTVITSITKRGAKLLETGLALSVASIVVKLALPKGLIPLLASVLTGKIECHEPVSISCKTPRLDDKKNVLLANI